MEFLIDGGSSVNIIYHDTFQMLKRFMSVTLGKFCVEIHAYGCETPLPIAGKFFVEIYSNSTGIRTFATFHVIDAGALRILSKSTSKLLFVLSVLEPIRYEQISALTSSNLDYRLTNLLY